MASRKDLEKQLMKASLQQQYQAIDTANLGQSLLFGRNYYQRADGAGTASSAIDPNSPIGQAFSAFDEALAAAGLDVEARKSLSNQSSRMFFGEDLYDADGKVNTNLFDTGRESFAKGGFVKDTYDSYSSLKDKLSGYDQDKAGSTYAARGIADVTSTAQAQKQSALREAMRRGVNPSDGAFAAVQNSLTPQIAAASARAANEGRSLAFNEQQALRKEADTAYDRYMGTATAGQSALQSALNAQREAEDDRAKKATAKSDYISDTILG